MMGNYVELLRSLPKTVRDVASRAADRTPEVVEVARRYGAEYFDGDRRYGYGGYRYDGRWRPVVEEIIRYYDLHHRSRRVLDVGCAKGYLVRDLWAAGLEAFGLDASAYALRNCPGDIAGRLHLGSADDDLPFPDDSFDLVLSINTLHNLPRPRIVRALREMRRVSRGRMFVQVDSYRTPEEEAAFRDWVLTAEWTGYPHEWLALFEEAGYDGDYSWTIVEPASEARTGATDDDRAAVLRGAVRRGSVVRWCRANWDRLPAEKRRACLDRLREKLPAETVELMRAQHAAGLEIGSHQRNFHLGLGMAIRNALREVVPDEELLPIRYAGGEEYRNWDDYYTGALEELAEEEEKGR